MKKLAPILGGLIGASFAFFLGDFLFTSVLKWGANLFLVAFIVAGWMLGYRRYAPKSEPLPTAPTAPRDEGQLAETGELDPTDESRSVHIDQEELIEGSWHCFLPDLQRLLLAEGVAFEPVVTAGEHELTVELEGALLLRVTSEPLTENGAQEAIVQLARAVNRCLEAAGSTKHLYFLEGWNDLAGTLLTPDEFRSLCANGWDQSLWEGDDGRPVGAPFDSPPFSGSGHPPLDISQS